MRLGWSKEAEDWIAVEREDGAEAEDDGQDEFGATGFLKEI